MTTLFSKKLLYEILAKVCSLVDKFLMRIILVAIFYALNIYSIYNLKEEREMFIFF